MSRTLLVSVSPGELWAALCEGGEPVELHVLRPSPAPRAGEFLLGRVVALKPELPAALIDIGIDRPAFLSAEDTPERSLAGLTEGASLIVQVLKEARGGKAVNLSLRPRLDGALVALLPGSKTEIRARDLDAPARQRIEAELGALAATGEGFRAAAPAERLRAATAAALAADVAALRARWQMVLDASARVAAPARLEPEEPLVLSLLKTQAPLPERIVIDDRAAYAAARGFLLRQGKDPARLSLHADAVPLFEQEGVAAAIAAAQAPRVALPGGASLAIERTAAAILIDVDSGGAPAMATNLAAAEAVARQMRLRNLSGAIVIDFIAVKDRAQRARIAAALERAVADDPLAPRCLGWTRLGHFELVRTRRARALDEILFEPGEAWRKTALTVALDALRALARAGAAAGAPALDAAPEVAAALGDGEAKGARLELEARLGRAILVRAEPGWPRERFEVGGT